LASDIFGRTADNRREVCALRHELAVVNDADGQDRQRHERHQERELDRNGASVSAAIPRSQ
jgi:hypothetical protein